MTELRFTLVSDGSSDKALLPVLRWLLIANGVEIAINGNWADLRLLPQPPRTLRGRVGAALGMYPCELLFVHRDAERQPREDRVQEIRKAVREAAAPNDEAPPAVCVVPVRMTEAWLLFDEPAIRYASSNPLGRVPLEVPRIDALEKLPDPKTLLHDLLQAASGLTGRRLKKFSVSKAAARISERIDDFGPLRHLTAFTALEDELRTVLRDLNLTAA